MAKISIYKRISNFLQPSKPSLNQSSLALAFEEDDGVKEKEVRREKSGDEDPVPSRAS